MPHLNADAITEDAEGLAFLASVLNPPGLVQQAPRNAKTALPRQTRRTRRAPSAPVAAPSIAGADVAA